MEKEKKVIEKKMRLFICLVAFFFMLLLARVGYMQIAESEKYQALATQNHQRLIPVEAPRGEIFDSEGTRLVTNKPVYTVSLLYLGKKDLEPVIQRLSYYLVGENGFAGMSFDQIEDELRSKIKTHTRLYEPVRLAVNVSPETVTRIEEHRLEMPGVNIDVEPVRYYPFNDLLGEVLGYVREITGAQLAEHKDEGYSMGDSFGQNGLENIYQSYLRGIKGARQVEVDAQARPVRELGQVQPVPGNNLVLTVDHRLQRVAQDAVAEAIASARKLGYVRLPAGQAVSGAAVVLDVNTGKVLAMATVPSYDLNLFSGSLPPDKYAELLKSGAMRNHAIQTTYSPGSTFKMATASAFLEDGVVDENTSIYDPGYYKYKNCWKPGGHGTVNIIRALKYSCDTYFYTFGAQAGPDLMGRYALEYGFGGRSGIDLPHEESGRVASKDLKKKVWEGNDWESRWHEYDSMDMAIGQQESKVTAVQLANYVAAIANGGKLYVPQLMDRVIGPDGTVIKKNEPRVKSSVNVSAKSMDIIRKGMHEVTITGGTASGVFWGFPLSAAAKTGTSEVGDVNENAHALFAAYAPFEKPEIAVSVIIEYGGKGSGIAGPAARKIIDAYFKFSGHPAFKEDKKEVSAPASSSGTVAARPEAIQPPAREENVNPPAREEQGAGQTGAGEPGSGLVIPGNNNSSGGGSSGAAGGDEPPGTVSQ